MRVLAPEVVEKIQGLCAHYPTRMAALLPALHLVQNLRGCIDTDAAHDIASVLDIPPTRVNEAITFYTMFYAKAQGRHLVKVCRNLACQLRGADALIRHAEEVLGIKVGATTQDDRVTLEVEECLASCGTGPMLWCRSRADGEEPREQLVENLDRAKLESFLRALT